MQKDNECVPGRCHWFGQFIMIIFIYLKHEMQQAFHLAYNSTVLIFFFRLVWFDPEFGILDQSSKFYYPWLYFIV